MNAADTSTMHEKWTEPMQITVHTQSPEIAVVQLQGRLDLVSAGAVKQKFADLVAVGQRRLVVDLAEVSFIDSTGLTSLISGLKATRQGGGDLRIARPTQQARTILGLTTLDRVLHIYQSVEEALAGY